MARAILNGALLAESGDTVEVDGYVYFPERSVAPGVLSASGFTTRCTLEGQASYFDVAAADRTVRRGAFAYRSPLPAAMNVKGRVAFWKEIVVER